MEKEYMVNKKNAKMEGHMTPRIQKLPAVRLIRKVVAGPLATEGDGRGRGDESASSATSVASSFTVLGGGKARAGPPVVTQMEDEMDVFDIGFTRDVPIDWEAVRVPTKSELSKLLEYRITEFDCPDVLVKVGDHEHRCHMIVLQSYSEFFLEQNAVTRVELPEEFVSKFAFNYAYYWMIHKGPGSFAALSRGNVLEVLSAANFLRIKQLEEQCWAFVDSLEFFNEEQAFLLYLAARRAGNAAVMDMMVPRVKRFFLTLVASKEFVEMEIEEVERFLSSSFLCVRHEMDVFMAAVRWLMCDWEQRKRHAARAMACVRFGLIPPWHLVDVRRNPAPGNRHCLTIAGHPDVARMMDEGLAFSVVQYQHPRDSAEYRRAAEELSLKEPEGRCYTDSGKGKDKAPLYDDFIKTLCKYKAWYLSNVEGERGEAPKRRDPPFDTDDLVLLAK